MSAEPVSSPAPRPSAARAVARRALFGVVSFVALTAGGAWLMYASIDPREEAAEARTPVSTSEALASVKSWGYQLQRLDAARAATATHDLLVLDEQLDGTRAPRARAQLLRHLKQKPDGSRRLVLAYLSIGEAEDYRPYWDQGWVKASLVPAPELVSAEGEPHGMSGRPARLPAGRTDTALPLRQPTTAAPHWLGEENLEWRGNFRVRYWDPAWQALLLGAPDAALDRLIADGFDGVYLDRADVWAQWTAERSGARADMMALIQRISEHARARAPGFLVVMQNAEELLGNSRLRRAIDAVAKEDLLYGVEGTGQPNGAREVQASLDLLRRARKDGLPVLVVEYIDEREKIAAARQQLEGEGFVPTFTARDLDSLP